MLLVAAVIPYWFRLTEATFGIGQILSSYAVFSIFCNWLIFSMFSALGRENPETFPFVISKFSALADYRAGGRQTSTEARVARLRRAASSHFPRTYSSLQSSRCQGESFPTEPCLSLASISGGAAKRNPVPAAQTVPLPAAPAILTSVAHCDSLNREPSPSLKPWPRQENSVPEASHNSRFNDPTGVRIRYACCLGASSNPIGCRRSSLFPALFNEKTSLKMKVYPGKCFRNNANSRKLPWQNPLGRSYHPLQAAPPPDTPIGCFGLFPL